MTRETMEFDIVIVGAGPAGLSAAIQLSQLAQAQQPALSICVLEKSATIGGHILSGAVLEPTALNELIPDWQERGAPINCQATEDRFLWLTEKRAFRLPTPPPMRNEGNYIISLGLFCQWLAEQAEQLGVSIFPGFAATELITEQGRVIGVSTGDMGINKAGEQTERYQPGVNILAKQVLLAEGCHGSLSKAAIKQFNLREPNRPQTYALGIKELWEVPAAQHQQGLTLHSVGWPLQHATYGGSFCYHWDQQRVLVGFVVGLDYQNPTLDPFQELQRFKPHPAIRPMLEGGKRLAYGARSLVEGGLQSLPQCHFPGGLLIGDSAGFLNVPKIKGIHCAMKSGMLAAQTLYDHLAHCQNRSLNEWDAALQNSWLYQELHSVRNIRPGFKWGLRAGLLHAALDTYLFRGKAPWTLSHHPDHLALSPLSDCTPITYPKPDGKLTFDKLSSVNLANLDQPEDQPCHLKLADPTLAITVNHTQYGSPETHYCPANVYEILDNGGTVQLQINASNCVHCKTCDIKDPTQNIHWTPPEGGSGPNYSEM